MGSELASLNGVFGPDFSIPWQKVAAARSLSNPYRSVGLGQAADGLAGVHAYLHNLAGDGVAQGLAFAGDLEAASSREDRKSVV